MMVTALLDNEDFDVPSTEDLLRWEETYGSSHPLLTDVRDEMRSFVEADEDLAEPPGMPYTALIDRGGVIVDVAQGTITIDDALALL